MENRVAIVTGANRGLGKAIAEGLARQGLTVMLGCRDAHRGEAARAAISAATGNPRVEILPIDLADQQSIRAAVATIVGKHDRLDVLINNAAVYKTERTLTQDGLEAMFATNHLGPVLLTNLLCELLKASAPARILTITAPSTTQLKFDDLQSSGQWSAYRAFGASKMCNLLFTYELARRLQGTGVTVNAVHPGLVKSNLLQEAPRPIRFVANLVSASPEKASAGPVSLASSPAVAGVSGKFFKGQKQIKSSAYSHDPAMQRRLWEVSVALTGLA